MAVVEFEIRVAGPVPASVLEEPENIEVVTEAVDTVLRGPRAGPGRAGRHHQPAAGLGHRTARDPTTMTSTQRAGADDTMREYEILVAGPAPFAAAPPAVPAGSCTVLGG